MAGKYSSDILLFPQCTEDHACSCVWGIWRMEQDMEWKRKDGGRDIFSYVFMAGILIAFIVAYILASSL